MIVRCEIAEPGGLGPPSAAVPVPDSTARIRWTGLPTKAGRSSASASAADMFMNDAGNRFANCVDYRNQFFHLSMNERGCLKFVKPGRAPGTGKTALGEQSGTCLAPFPQDFTIFFVQTNRTTSMKVGMVPGDSEGNSHEN